MTINGTRKVIDRFKELFQLEAENENIKTAVIDPVYDGIIFRDIAQIDRMALEFQQNKINNGIYITLNEAKMVIMLSSIINDNKEDNAKLPDSFFDALFESAKFFSKSDLMKDPYLAHVKLPEEEEQRKISDICVKTSKLPKYSPFFYSGPELYEPGNSIPRIGFVDKATKIFTAYRDNRYLTSVSARTVLEENTVSRSFSGKVLVLGCGLGHFLYLSSLNPNITEIIAMDEDGNILNLMDKTILPQAPFREKIALIQGDEKQFIYQMTDYTFDYIYVGQSVTNGSVGVFLQILNKFMQFDHTSFAIEAEGELRNSYRNLLMIALHDECVKNGWVDSETKEKLTVNPRAQNELDFIKELLQPAVIQTADDIDRLMDPENLILLNRRPEDIKPEICEADKDE